MCAEPASFHSAKQQNRTVLKFCLVEFSSPVCMHTACTRCVKVPGDSSIKDELTQGKKCCKHDFLLRLGRQGSYSSSKKLLHCITIFDSFARQLQTCQETRHSAWASLGKSSAPAFSRATHQVLELDDNQVNKHGDRVFDAEPGARVLVVVLHQVSDESLLRPNPLLR